jgi:hypothetical protein
VQDRDLIAGVLAAQGGFATPSEVISASAALLMDPGSESLLTRLVRTGTLSGERRKLLEQLVEQTLVARNGNAHEVLTSLGATPALVETLVSAIAGISEAPGLRTRKRRSRSSVPDSARASAGSGEAVRAWSVPPATRSSALR